MHIVVGSDVRIAAILKDVRLSAGLTQKELAVKLFISAGAVQKIENNTTGKGLVSWLRYMPKVWAWLQACSVSAQFVVHPLAPVGHGVRAGARDRRTREDQNNQK